MSPKSLTTSSTSSNASPPKTATLAASIQVARGRCASGWLSAFTGNPKNAGTAFQPSGGGSEGGSSKSGRVSICSTSIFASISRASSGSFFSAASLDGRGGGSASNSAASNQTK